MDGRSGRDEPSSIEGRGAIANPKGGYPHVGRERTTRVLQTTFKRMFGSKRLYFEMTRGM